MILILKVTSKLSSAENDTCQNEEASELSHIGLLYNLSSQKYICVTLSDSFENLLLSSASSYRDLELLTQLVNTRESSLSINIMNVHTQANWDK